MINVRFAQTVVVLVLALLVASSALAEAPVAAAERETANRLIDAARPSLAHVEYSLQYDNGQAPYGSGWATRCPNCGRFHGEDTDELVTDERPAEVAGFIIAPDQVLTSDFMMHPRFIRQIQVRVGDQTVGARVAATYRNHKAVLLQLDAPLKDVKPLAFATADGPYFAISHILENGVWQTSAQPLGGTVTAVGESGPRFVSVSSNTLVVSKDGTPITIATDDELPADDSWKTPPAKWEAIQTDKLDQMSDAVRQRVDQGVLRVQLNLRSPRQQPNQRFSLRDEDENATERQALGLLYEQNRVLVLTSFDAKTTARLERITLHLPDGSTAPAEFEASLTDYGALVVKTQSPLAGPISLSDEDIRAFRNRLLMQAEINLQGDKRVVYLSHRRIPAFEVGWRRHIYPTLAGGQNDRFLFNDAGQLLVLPIIKREKPGAENSYRSNVPVQTSASYLRPVLADLARHSDPANVPLSEADEFRIAWLGVELQPLDADLARMNNVSDLTDGGSSGALVTHVYPASPAGKAGLKVGDVLLRMHIPDRPEPVNLTVDEYQFSEIAFPWDRYEELPEQYFDQVPRPWPAVETPVARTLTEVGFGRPFELEYAVDGKAQRKSFKVEQSPTHYDTAAKATVAGLGLTVREMTFEVRRYFQRKEDEPGVIISHIDIGSRASKAGLKPYEYITHVNDQPVTTPQAFAEQVQAGGDIRLSVRRNTRGRVVKVTLEATTQPTTIPTTQAAALPTTQATKDQ